jgi:diguanylate cyclase (GGDEF)-like protein
METTGPMRLRPSSPLTIKLQLTLVFGALVVLAAVVLTWVLGEMLRERVRADAGRVLTLLSGNAAHVLADDLATNADMVDLLARREAAWAAGLDSPEAQRMLDLIQATAPRTHLWVGVADAGGTVRAATGSMLLGQSVAQRPWFQHGSVGPFVGDVHPAKLLATLLPADRDGEPQRFVDYAAPVVREGRRLGVLGVHASWDWVGEVVDAVLSTQAGGSGIEIFIFDREGRVIFAPRGQSQKLAAADVRMPALRGSTPAVATWHDGAEWLTAIARLPASRELGDLGWTIVAREPAATVFGDVRDASRHVLLAGVLAALVGALLVRFAAVRLGADVRRLSKAARDIELGVPGAHLPPAASSAELRSLSDALGRMTTRLMATQDDLERQVRERTAELEAANAELGRQARTDPLTGLPNRRSFDLQMDHALAAARRHGQPVAVLMIDADHFKRINDLHGHPVGDDVLVMLAGVLRARLRESDLLARYGGEEFVALLPGATQADALSVAQALVAAVAARRSAVYGQVTVSIGVAAAPPAEQVAWALMRRADEALYQAKAQGRNRACVHGEGTGPTAGTPEI